MCTSSEPRHSGGTRDRRTVSTKITVRLVSLTDAPAEVTAETNLPRHQAGQVSIFFSYVEHRGFEPLTFSLRKPPCRGLAPLGGGFTPADGCSGAVDSNSGARRGPAPKPVFDFRSGAVHAGENFATASVSGMERGGTLADYAMWVRAAGQTHTLQHMMKWDGSPTLPTREYPAEERELRFFFDSGHPWSLWEN